MSAKLKIPLHRTQENKHLWKKADEVVKAPPAHLCYGKGVHPDAEPLKLPYSEQGRKNFDDIFRKKKNKSII